MTPNIQINRQPEGIPTGDQFAAGQHGEAPALLFTPNLFTFLRSKSKSSRR
jgi:hypothetical protein